MFPNSRFYPLLKCKHIFVELVKSLWNSRYLHSCKLISKTCSLGQIPSFSKIFQKALLCRNKNIFSIIPHPPCAITWKRSQEWTGAIVRTALLVSRVSGSLSPVAQHPLFRKPMLCCRWESKSNPWWSILEEAKPHAASCFFAFSLVLPCLVRPLPLKNKIKKSSLYYLLFKVYIFLSSVS